MLRSPAWRALSPNGKAVLLHLWERHNGSNNGQIVYEVRAAAEIGLTRSPAARALAELIELGFLRITRDSAFRIKTKEAREWAITAEPIDGQAATKDFMHWPPSKNKTRSPQRDAQSPQRDREAVVASDYRVSVPQEGPSEPKSTPPQSPQRDTSILPGGTAPDGETPPSTSTPLKLRRAPLRFGDDAKAQRIGRKHPYPLDHRARASR
jgi:hypothetical protein